MPRKQAFFQTTYGVNNASTTAATAATATAATTTATTQGGNRVSDTTLDTQPEASVVVTPRSVGVNKDELSPVSVAVPQCFPPVSGYMTLKGVDVQFFVSPNIVIEALNIGADATERLHMMKEVLLLPAEKEDVTSKLP
jgi:hypothetical protein